MSEGQSRVRVRGLELTKSFGQNIGHRQIYSTTHREFLFRVIKEEIKLLIIF